MHIFSNISRSKDNEAMKFGQLIEHNMRNISLEKSFTKCGRETILRLFSKKSKLSISLDQYSKVLVKVLNVDLKITSKEKLKKLLPDLISSQQTAYVKNRHIGESGRLISGVIEIAKIKKFDGFLVAMDTEKASDSLDHNFLTFTLENYGSGVLCY